MEQRVEMKNITKTFAGVAANDSVNLTLNCGEIHALLGENGAGKSTLMNILDGIYKQDAGDIYIDGKKTVIQSPKDAIANGIGMIHQHFKLVDAFTVAENIVLGTKLDMFISERKINEKIRDIGEKYGLDVDASAYVSHLSVGEQQRVEIVKALYRNANLLILDEPTAVLTPQEAKTLFEALRDMAKRDCAIVIISHKLDEIEQIADVVTVLRKGKVVGTVKGDKIQKEYLSKLMMGEEIETNDAPLDTCTGEEVLTVKSVSAYNDKGVLGLDDMTFSARAGEILGVAGVAGNGQNVLSEILTGMRDLESGEITLDGARVDQKSVRERLQAGIAFVPEDRLGTGLVGDMDSIDNYLLRTYDKQKGIFINFSEVQQKVKDAIEEYDIAMANVHAPVRFMSGGNMQKLLLAREISLHPKLLILTYPVRGLDISAMEKVYSSMISQREKGCAILFISEDLDALMKFSDRIMVMCQGKNMGIVERERATLTNIGLMMGGRKLQDGRQDHEAV